jgi:hypothetical protein
MVSPPKRFSRQYHAIMGTDALVASLVSSLAWPIAIVILAGLIFRHQLQDIFAELAKKMKDLIKFKGPGTELAFAETLMQAQGDFLALKWAVKPAETGDVKVDIPATTYEKLTDDTKASDTKPQRPPTVFLDPNTHWNLWLASKPVELSNYLPAQIVAFGWNAVEESVRTLAMTLGMGVDASYDANFYAFAASVLTNADVSSGVSRGKSNSAVTGALSIIERLWNIKSQVLNKNTTISRNMAYDYANIALGMAKLVEDWTNNGVTGTNESEQS